MTPPRLFDWLLRRSLPPGPAGDAIRGDLLEELAASPHQHAGAASLPCSRVVDRGSLPLVAARRSSSSADGDT